MELTDEDGQIAWSGSYKAWGWCNRNAVRVKIK
ncbi:RHS domain-containing protein [Pseudomonas sp. NPDC090233]